MIGASACTADDNIKRQILKLFPQADTDKDGVISDAEEAVVSRQALKRYPKADKDGDGVLSNAEKVCFILYQIWTLKRNYEKVGTFI